jgi:hypothetical protein
MADRDIYPSTPQLDWQQKFQAALLEGDRKRLPQLVEAAEAAIFLRLQSLVNSPDGHVERAALTDAMRTLRVIQTEKMHYPPWKSK